MKRILILFMVMFLFACSNKVATGNNDSSAEEQPADEIEEVEVNEKADEEDGVYFDGKVAQIEMVKVEIKDTKVIPVGEEGNEYGEKPVFAIWYDATNFTDEEIDPISAWLAIFDAIQDNDPNMINKLEVGSLPDEKHLDTQMNIIKKDGTVENSIAYELDDLETPVTLVATQGIGGDEIGRHDYEIK